jgi:hemerythrin superfamily protein
MEPSTSRYRRKTGHIFANRSSQLLNEIMPMIYKRFTEKASEEWRQIYKVLRMPSCLLLY